MCAELAAVNQSSIQAVTISTPELPKKKQIGWGPFVKLFSNNANLANALEDD